MTARPHVSSLLALFALVAMGAAGCKAKIGDSCSLSTDCSATGDRLCDTSQPGGYCTLFNCEPGRCPDEAVCVAFRVVADGTDATCDDPQRWARFERSFCERTCGSNSDCRAGYTCANEAALTMTWNAKIAEPDQSANVCVPTPTAAPATSQDAGVDVCKPNKGWDGGVIPEWDGGASGAGGLSGGAGASGAAGSGVSGAAGSGASGTGGASGAAGSNGTSGGAGASGKSGASGAAGKAGAAGKGGAGGVAGGGGAGAGGVAGASGSGGAAGAAGASGAGGAGGM